MQLLIQVGVMFAIQVWISDYCELIPYMADTYIE